MIAATVLASEDTIETKMHRTAKAAKEAGKTLALADAGIKNAALRAAAASIRTRSDEIISANDKDMAAAEGRNLMVALQDRLKLTPGRVEAMATGLEEVAERDDPVGKLIDEWSRPNGLRISRVSVPLGVIGIIYEARPNVTADAGGLCLKSGNAAILRGGSDSIHSSGAIADCLSEGLKAAGLPGDAIQFIRTSDRAAVGVMLRQHDLIDIIVPRGGRGLIERVMEESTIPVLAHLEGICHVYVDGAADLAMAREIVLNAKMRRTGICGAAETLLIDRSQADTQLSGIVDDLVAANCEVRGDADAQAIDQRIIAATDSDWETEYLDAIISIKVVNGVSGAVDHINRHGTNHTDTIVTEDTAAAEVFLSGVDSGIVMHNASTQFADGGEFGMGAEIGISTGKLHARGPVGADQLTSYKYVVRGDGQTRP